MVTRSVVQSAVHTTAMAMIHVPPEEWPGWVAYLCEELEKAAQERGLEYDVEAMAQEICALLRERVAHGSW